MSINPYHHLHLLVLVKNDEAKKTVDVVFCFDTLRPHLPIHDADDDGLAFLVPCPGTTTCVAESTEESQWNIADYPYEFKVRCQPLVCSPS